MIYLHENGVTIVATKEAKRGKVYELNGEKYYVARGVADIQRIVDSGEFPLNRVITSKLTSLNYLFQIYYLLPQRGKSFFMVLLGIHYNFGPLGD